MPTNPYQKPRTRGNDIVAWKSCPNYWLFLLSVEIFWRQFVMLQKWFCIMHYFLFVSYSTSQSSMHRVHVLVCVIVVRDRLIISIAFRITSLARRQPVPGKQPWRIWVNRYCVYIKNCWYNHNKTVRLWACLVGYIICNCIWHAATLELCYNGFTLSVIISQGIDVWGFIWLTTTSRGVSRDFTKCVWAHNPNLEQNSYCSHRKKLGHNFTHMTAELLCHGRAVTQWGH